MGRISQAHRTSSQRLVKTSIQLAPDQVERVNRIAEREVASASTVIRRFIAEGLAADDSRATAKAAS